MLKDALTPHPFDAFDRRLSADSHAPIGVAFSGGGDSLMALKAAVAWTERHGRRVVAFHVDHRLQASSAGWALAAAAAADRLGAAFLSLAWTGDKPSTGLPAAARIARHGLIADAARQAGVRVVVFGHTADDQIEAVLMRDSGLRMGGLREWAPSPVWPEGRGLFVFRPLLGLRRAAIRQALAAEGEQWIDDPANIDPRSARARVRPLAAGLGRPAVEPDDGLLARLASLAAMGEGGDIRIDRAILRAAAPSTARRLIGAAAASVGGATGPPRGGRLEALTNRVLGQSAVSATLCGARVLAGDEVRFARDAGEASRGGLAPIALGPNETGVWDGRFEVTAGAEPLTVVRLAGRAPGLDRAERGRLRALPASVRPGLPLTVLADGRLTCALLAGTGLAGSASIGVKPLVAARFLAACGVISKEPAT